MEFAYRLTSAEIQEAVRLNRSKVSRLWRVLRYLRLVMVIGALLVVIVANLRSRTPNWSAVVGLAFAAAFLAIVAVWSWAFRDRRRVRRRNAAGERMKINADGIAMSDGQGATTVSPWAQFRVWREGRLVFTVGDAKTFRVVPKAALDETQMAELRGMLETQIRTQ